MTQGDETINNSDIERAQKWYREHIKHVDYLMTRAQAKFPPSGSDKLRPELWKPESWLWFRQEGFLNG